MAHVITLRPQDRDWVATAWDADVAVARCIGVSMTLALATLGMELEGRAAAELGLPGDPTDYPRVVKVFDAEALKRSGALMDLANAKGDLGKFMERNAPASTYERMEGALRWWFWRRRP